MRDDGVREGGCVRLDCVREGGSVFADGVREGNMPGQDMGWCTGGVGIREYWMLKAGRRWEGGGR